MQATQKHELKKIFKDKSFTLAKNNFAENENKRKLRLIGVFLF